MENKTDKIKIDERTKLMLADLQRTINELNGRFSIILQVYLNAQGITDGQYNVTPDFEYLIKAVEPANPSADGEKKQ